MCPTHAYVTGPECGAGQRLHNPTAEATVEVQHYLAERRRPIAVLEVKSCSLSKSVQTAVHSSTDQERVEISWEEPQPVCTEEDKKRMNLYSVFFFYLFSGVFTFPSPPLTQTFDREIPVYAAVEEEDVSFDFLFTLVGGGTKYLCREECNANILIQTNSSAAQRGRYSISYHDGALKVTISRLQVSDSGRYRCGVGCPRLPDSYEEVVEIRVEKAKPADKWSKQPNMRTSGQTRDLGLMFSSTITKTDRELSTAENTVIVSACWSVLAVVLVMSFIIIFFKLRTKLRAHDLSKKTEETDDTFVTYENWAPVSGYEDSTYQSLDPLSVEVEVYFTLK
ncbi:hypothetical protein OJAV_G00070920 [Oryzias javanicus]|uniref:Immunoglobulin subtype domain-containing protein n=1 Tax=Oryzias javanicus TaxID=123683 RepID=A0A437D8H8_ORYJA|nr:hypothetical protein OJAV_G00070920 [Oryzias javanicus]